MAAPKKQPQPHFSSSSASSLDSWLLQERHLPTVPLHVPGSVQGGPADRLSSFSICAVTVSVSRRRCGRACPHLALAGSLSEGSGAGGAEGSPCSFLARLAGLP